MKKTRVIILTIIAIIFVAIIASIIWYNIQQKPIDVKNPISKTIEITPGMGAVEISDLLDKEGIVKSSFATKIYIKLNKVNSLKAGKYELSTDMPLEAILTKISDGEVISKEISITFLEGKNIRWFAKKIAENTNNTEVDVYSLLQDKQYIKTLINKYWFLTTDVQNVDIYYPLEGYLYPDTYTFSSVDVSVKEIFNILLNQTDKILSKYKIQIQENKYNVHDILTVASIIELEGKTGSDRSGIASVIYNRIQNNMKIGSDVTTYYGIKVDMGERNLYKQEINAYNPYNTRGPNMNGKLPVGPIGAVSEEALNAALKPSESEYLYFVADINGKIHFTQNYKAHQEKILELRKQGLWYEYN